MTRPETLACGETRDLNAEAHLEIELTLWHVVTRSSAELDIVTYVDNVLRVDGPVVVRDAHQTIVATTEPSYGAPIQVQSLSKPAESERVASDELAPVDAVD